MPSLKKLTRDKLNDKALKLGIENAVYMDTRGDVIEAIEAAKAEGRPEARVISVIGTGMFVLVEMHVDRAAEVLGDLPLGQAGRTDVLDATKAQLTEIRERDPTVGNSAIAAGALRMAYELDNPYTSPTAKANCLGELHRAMDRLLELAPPKEQQGGKLHEIKGERTARRNAA